MHFVPEEPELVAEEAARPQQGHEARVSPVLRVRVRLLETPDREERRRVVDQWWQDWRDGKLPVSSDGGLPQGQGCALELTLSASDGPGGCTGCVCY